MNFPNVVPGHTDGWSQIRTSFYNELLANQGELLSALVDLLDACPASCEDKRLIECQRRAEAIIAKAKGLSCQR